MPRIDQSIPLNERQILKRVLNENDTLAVDNITSERPGHYLFNYTTEQAVVDQVTVHLDVTTITEFVDPMHENLRRTIVVKRLRGRVHSLDITNNEEATETRS